MNLYIHKIDCLLDGDALNDTVNGEPLACMYALAKSPQCAYERIYVIGKHQNSVHKQFTNTTQTHTTTICFLNAIDWLQNKIDTKLCSDDTWILWGGWVELLDICREPWEAKAIVDLTNKWSHGLHLKFALCTDMRFPFKPVVYTKQGRMDLVVDSTQFGKVTELTQCINRRLSIFNDCKFLPLFTMPMHGDAPWSNIKTFKQKQYDASGKGRSIKDFTFPTRDWNNLGTVKLDKFINYHIDPEFKTWCPGMHTHVASLFRRMTKEQICIADDCLRFEDNVPFFKLPEAMSHAIASVAIDHEEYEKFGLIPNRVGEAIKAGIFCFIDNDIDPDHKLFSNSILANATYVKNIDELKTRMSYFKANESAYINYCQMQRNWVLQQFDLASYYFSVLAEKSMQHQCQANCDACERGLI